MNFNQIIRRGYGGAEKMADSLSTSVYKPRTFKETIEDQISFHKNKIAELEAVKNSLTPEIEKFVETIQKLG